MTGRRAGEEGTMDDPVTGDGAKAGQPPSPRRGEGGRDAAQLEDAGVGRRFRRLASGRAGMPRRRLVGEGFSRT